MANVNPSSTLAIASIPAVVLFISMVNAVALFDVKVTVAVTLPPLVVPETLYIIDVADACSAAKLSTSTASKVPFTFIGFS